MSYKPYKKEFEFSYAFGVYPTIELLKYQAHTVAKVLLHSAGFDNQGVKKIIDYCEEKGIRAETNDKAVHQLSKKENCYAIGIFAKTRAALRRHENHIVLVNPSDMGNLGIIIRTMVGFGVMDLGIVRPGADVFDPKVVRVSMGALFQIRVQYFDDFEQYANAFDNDIYTFMLQAKTPLHRVNINKQKRFTLVFGNEGSGLGDAYTSIGNSVVIPHSRKIDSLNLAVAVGLAAYRFTAYSSHADR